MTDIPHVQLESILTFDGRRFRIQFGVVEQQTLRDAIEAMENGNPPDNLESETLSGVLELADGADAGFTPNKALEHHLNVLHACGDAAGLRDKDARSIHIAARIDETISWLVSSGFLRSWPEPPRIYARARAADVQPEARQSN